MSVQGERYGVGGRVLKSTSNAFDVGSRQTPGPAGFIVAIIPKLLASTKAKYDHNMRTRPCIISLSMITMTLREEFPTHYSLNATEVTNLRNIDCTLTEHPERRAHIHDLCLLCYYLMACIQNPGQLRLQPVVLNYSVPLFHRGDVVVRPTSFELQTYRFTRISQRLFLSFSELHIKQVVVAGAVWLHSLWHCKPRLPLCR
jgi:hypothetical protein